MPHSLHKGQRAEREVIGRLQPIIDHVYAQIRADPPKLERRGLGLSGQDILGIDWLALEIKHHEKTHLGQWWEQCLHQSRRRNGYRAVPVLAYKLSHRGWRVRMEGYVDQHIRHGCVVDISFEDFEYWFYHRLLKEVESESKR